jgi:hypothetical protein
MERCSKKAGYEWSDGKCRKKCKPTTHKRVKGRCVLTNEERAVRCSYKAAKDLKPRDLMYNAKTKKSSCVVLCDFDKGRVRLNRRCKTNKAFKDIVKNAVGYPPNRPATEADLKTVAELLRTSKKGQSMTMTEREQLVQLLNHLLVGVGYASGEEKLAKLVQMKHHHFLLPAEKAFLLEEEAPPVDMEAGHHYFWK